MEANGFLCGEYSPCSFRWLGVSDRISVVVLPLTAHELFWRAKVATLLYWYASIVCKAAMPLQLRFGKPKLKSPHELVAKTNAALSVLASVQRDRAVDKAIEDVGRYLEQMKIYIFGSADHPATKEKVLLLAKEVCAQGLLLGLCRNLVEIEFESRKDAALVVGALVRVNDEADQYPAVEYLKDHPAILRSLFDGCGSSVELTFVAFALRRV